MAHRIRSSCKDCGTDVGMGWWVGRFAHPGAAGPRCQPCYLTYTRDKQNARLHGRTNRTPWVLATHPLGPPCPTGEVRLVPCSDCGSEFYRDNVSTRCEPCRVANYAAHRGVAEGRRSRAVRAGDRGITWQAVAERDGWGCHLCGKVVRRVAGGAGAPLGATVDHLVPIADGGAHTWSNVALAHRQCNIVRGARGIAQLRLVG